MDPTNIPVLAVRITRTNVAKKCRQKRPRCENCRWIFKPVHSYIVH